tara:strand:+ start:633 stop:827 length:195 start_codon:yes stop_codon:yes gene_type:complete
VYVTPFRKSVHDTSRQNHKFIDVSVKATEVEFAGRNIGYENPLQSSFTCCRDSMVAIDDVHGGS